MPLKRTDAEEAGIEVVAVNPANISQACSGCGETVRKGLLAKRLRSNNVRVYSCFGCGIVLDRDINATVNILAPGPHAVLSTQSARASTYSNGTQWVPGGVLEAPSL